MASIVVKSFVREGRLIPRRPRGLRASVVRLPPRGVMAWHSTEGREELLLVVGGEVEVQISRRPSRSHPRRRALRKGQCAFLPARTHHRVVNRSRAPARYLYVTGAA